MKVKSGIKIRSVLPENLEQVIELCKLHSEYEGQAYDRQGKLENLSSALFKVEPALWCFVADDCGVIQGYTTATKEFSTWDASYYLHMDCLFLLESTRGLGLGSLFITALTELAITESCNQIQWQTPVDNFGAIKFYTKCGATNKRKQRFFLDVSEMEK